MTTQVSLDRLREELLKAEHILNTEYSFDRAEPGYRKCLEIIALAPNERVAFEQLLVELFLRKAVSSEPLAYLMHVLRWQNVRQAVEADLRKHAEPIVTGTEHAKVLDGFQDDWENKEFYQFK